MNKKEILQSVESLLYAYENGALGATEMPEDTCPKFSTLEEKRIYYTLPMALNYQRNSYELWKSAKNTWEDKETREVFNLEITVDFDEDELRALLVKYKVASQPNRHIYIWQKLVETIYENWGSVTTLLQICDYDYLQVKNIVQQKFKKGFPYLSGPKIFNYWMYIMSEYGEVDLKNRSFIEIAPDTHVIQATEKLGLASGDELSNMSREEVSALWREVLKETNIDPIDVHSPLWFWSRSGFEFKLL